MDNQCTYRSYQSHNKLAIVTIVIISHNFNNAIVISVIHFFTELSTALQILKYLDRETIVLEVYNKIIIATMALCYYYRNSIENGCECCTMLRTHFHSIFTYFLLQVIATHICTIITTQRVLLDPRGWAGKGEIFHAY